MNTNTEAAAPVELETAVPAAAASDAGANAAMVVAAYVSNHQVEAAALPTLISDVIRAFSAEAAASEPSAVAAEPPVPAVPVEQSITSDYLVCLEDGKRFKSLKRHLMTHFGLTPELYRAKWSLPADYPMVAPDYAARRSAMALAAGLGRKPAPAALDLAA